jgi:hypothetical protein
VLHAIPGEGTPGNCRVSSRGVSEHNDEAGDARPANLILIEQSGAKHEIPQPSFVSGVIEAERAMHRHGRHLREVKVISRHTALARWKADELGWRRVA